MFANGLIGDIPPGLLDIGAKGFVAIIVLMVLTGRLVPGKERDHWRDLAMELTAQNTKLIAGGETTQHVLRSLPGQGEGTPP